MVGEAIGNKAKLALFNVLLDWIPTFVLADLHLCIAMPCDLDEHVKEGFIERRGSGMQGNVMEGADWFALGSCDEEAVSRSARSSDLLYPKGGCHS